MKTNLSAPSTRSVRSDSSNSSLNNRNPVLSCPSSTDLGKNRIVYNDDQLQSIDLLSKNAPWKNVPSLDSLPQNTNNPFADLEEHSHSSLFFDEEYWQKHFKDFCTNDCLARYLRANEWNVDKAYNGLLATLIWRRKFGPHLIRPSDVEAEAETGKQYINGFALNGSPIIYIRPHRNKSKDYPKHVRYLVFTVEKAIALLPKGQEKLTLIFDFSQYSSSTSTPMHVSKYFLHLFSQHYPERLGHAFACDAPWYFWAFYRIISPFIHPVTKEKIRFVDTKNSQANKTEAGIWSNLLNFINPNMLESDFGGNFSFEYVHSVYWPLITAVNGQEVKNSFEEE